ncbi:MAG: hypothetical protein WBA93_21515 [Microcoleaceae cyanobacterium]
MNHTFDVEILRQNVGRQSDGESMIFIYITGLDRHASLASSVCHRNLTNN